MNDRPTSTPGRRRPVSSRLRWVFRIGAVLLSCGLVLVAELLCAAFGWGDLQPADDPFVEFSSVRPLFERVSPSAYAVSVTQAAGGAPKILPFRSMLNAPAKTGGTYDTR